MVYGQQVQRSEITDDIVDLRMQREAIEDRQIDRETRALAPDAENFRKSSEQNTRRCNAGQAGAGFEATPLFRFQSAAARYEPWLFDGRRMLRERKIRRRINRRYAAAPILHG